MVVTIHIYQLFFTVLSLANAFTFFPCNQDILNNQNPQFCKEFPPSSEYDPPYRLVFGSCQVDHLQALQGCQENHLYPQGRECGEGVRRIEIYASQGRPRVKPTSSHHFTPIPILGYGGAYMGRGYREQELVCSSDQTGLASTTATPDRAELQLYIHAKYSCSIIIHT